MGCSSSSVSPEQREFQNWAARQQQKKEESDRLNRERAAQSWGGELSLPANSHDDDDDDGSASVPKTSEALARAMDVVRRWTEKERRLRVSLHMLFRYADAEANGTLELHEFATLAHKSSPSAEEKKKAQELSRELLQQIDADGSGAISEREFVEWIIEGESKIKKTCSVEDDSSTPKVKFLRMILEKSNAMMQSFSMLFNDGRMDFPSFADLLVSGSSLMHLRNEDLDIGSEKTLWYHAKLLSKSNAGVRSRVEGDRLYERDIIDFLLAGYLVAAEVRSYEARGLVSGVKVSTHEKNVHIRLRLVLETCIFFKMLPAMEEIQRDQGDAVRNLAIEQWFARPDEIISLKDAELLVKEPCKNMPSLNDDDFRVVAASMDDDGEGTVSLGEFKLFINRQLLARDKLRQEAAADQANGPLQVRAAMMCDAERRIERMFRWRTALFECFERYSEGRGEHARLSKEHMAFFLQDLGRGETLSFDDSLALAATFFSAVEQKRRAIEKEARKKEKKKRKEREKNADKMAETPNRVEETVDKEDTKKDGDSADDDGSSSSDKEKAKQGVSTKKDDDIAEAKKENTDDDIAKARKENFDGAVEQGDESSDKDKHASPPDSSGLSDTPSSNNEKDAEIAADGEEMEDMDDLSSRAESKDAERPSSTSIKRDEFVEHSLHLLATESSEKLSHALRSRIEHEQSEKLKHATLALRTLFLRYSRRSSTKGSEAAAERWMSAKRFRQMMENEFSMDIEQSQVEHLFLQIKNLHPTASAVEGKSGDIEGKGLKEDEFCHYFARGFELSHEHKTVYSRRSEIHKKVFHLLDVLLQRLNQRVTNLEHVFEKADDGSGTLDPSELKELISSYVNELDEPDEDDAMELINFIDRNGDQNIKREEFVSFFVSTLYHLEAKDESWKATLNVGARDMIQAFSEVLLANVGGKIDSDEEMDLLSDSEEEEEQEIDSGSNNDGSIPAKEDADRGAEVVLHSDEDDFTVTMHSDDDDDDDEIKVDADDDEIILHDSSGDDGGDGGNEEEGDDDHEGEGAIVVASSSEEEEDVLVASSEDEDS
eukprot:g3710.t1